MFDAIQQYQPTRGLLMRQSDNSKMLRGELRRNEPMAKHTSWRVGGSADRFYIPADMDDLALFLARQPAQEPLLWLGLGSNLLVRDGGIRGTVIAMKYLVDDMQDLSGGRIRAGAGTACAKVARFSVKCGYGGVEFLAGIPGTLGGALAMNAGAFGGEIWTKVIEVETINHRGERRRRARSEFQIGYRSVRQARDEWFLSACLQLQSQESAQGEEMIRALLAQRAAGQPTGEHSCGSVFRNPEGDYAGRLIESCGLKGKQIGGACISDKHANFIINTGKATAEDIEQLIKTIQQTVVDRTGIQLQPEVRMAGESLHI